MYGIDEGKMTLIVTDKGAEIAEQIDAYSGRGSTILKGIGSYSKKDKDVVMCACNNKQMYTIKKMVHTIDPKAFTIIVESNEVVGEGFKEELPDIVQRWRNANPRIRDLWYAVEQAALTTMQTAQPQGINGLIFRYEGELMYGQSFLTVQLPSGRKLFYPKPFLKENQFGKMAIHYYTVGQQTKNGKWHLLMEEK